MGLDHSGTGMAPVLSKGESLWRYKYDPSIDAINVTIFFCLVVARRPVKAASPGCSQPL